MILGDVLRVLSAYCHAFGIDHKDLYVLLFEEEDLNLEQTVKNTFGKRGLNQWIYKELVKDEGFLHLARIIDTRLLSVLGSHQDIYRDLYALVENDTHFSDSDKQQILSSFDPDDQKQLAQFIALCIISGNYNLPRRKSKQPANQTTYGINLKTFTANPEGNFLEHDLWEASQRDFFASRRRGGRFSSFHIITQLLPKIIRKWTTGILKKQKMKKTPQVCLASSVGCLQNQNVLPACTLLSPHPGQNPPQLICHRRMHSFITIMKLGRLCILTVPPSGLLRFSRS